MKTPRLVAVLGSVALLASTFFVASATAESKARIVRLSNVEGSVQIERAAGEGLEKAFLNLPIVEGARIKTGSEGRAEIEFEDGSTLRLANESELSFPRLALGDAGQKLSTVQLVSGTAYANLHEDKTDQFQLNFAKESIAVPEAAHFRVTLETASANVAVFKGAIKATGPTGDHEVAEKHSATIELASTDPADKDAFVISKNSEEAPLDAWDRKQNDYHDRYAKSAGSGFSSPYGYGMSDLNYYGSFMMIPGYGMGWQPYFVDASWDPFMDGGWAFYPGMGYMWVSGYPWGWMPYYYGNWTFVPGYGWVWQPGYWNTWYGRPRVVNPPARTKLPTAPTSGQKLVLVGRGLTSNPARVMGKLTIAPGSAGFGVPRGSVRHLDQAQRTMQRTSAPVAVAAQPPAPVTDQPSVFGGSSAPARGATMPRQSAPAHRSAPPAPPSRPH